MLALQEVAILGQKFGKPRHHGHHFTAGDIAPDIPQ
jgi:hypothetical protein